MAKSEASRKGRKLKAAAKPAEEQDQQVEAPEVVAPTEKRSNTSGRSRKSKTSKSSKTSAVVEVANMAGETAIDKAVDNGEFKTEFINADKEDQAAIGDKIFKKTGLNCRGYIHDFCDDCELLADLMLKDALKNKGGRQRCLSARMNLLTSLWQYRDTSDCEDDFPIEEFHKEMRNLATVQRKLRGLDSKISALMLGADDDSDDTDGDGEAQNLSSLKQARQNLRYALGEGQKGFS